MDVGASSRPAVRLSALVPPPQAHQGGRVRLSSLHEDHRDGERGRGGRDFSIWAES